MDLEDIDFTQIPYVIKDTECDYQGISEDDLCERFRNEFDLDIDDAYRLIGIVISLGLIKFTHTETTKHIHGPTIERNYFKINC